MSLEDPSLLLSELEKTMESTNIVVGGCGTIVGGEGQIRAWV